MLRTQAELNGIVCFDSNDSNPKKQIISSRSFGTKVTDKEHLKEAIAMHIAKATRKLREQGSVCGAMVIKIRSSPFLKPFYARSAVCEFHGLTSDTLLMTQYAFRELEYIYKPKVFYAKVGVMLCDISPVDCYQGHLFNPEDSNKRKDLMHLMDNLNLRFGKNTIIHGAEGLSKSWAMKNQYRTPAYTTDWHDIFCVD